MHINERKTTSPWLTDKTGAMSSTDKLIVRVPEFISIRGCKVEYSRVQLGSTRKYILEELFQKKGGGITGCRLKVTLAERRRGTCYWHSYTNCEPLMHTVKSFFKYSPYLFFLHTIKGRVYITDPDPRGW